MNDKTPTDADQGENVSPFAEQMHLVLSAHRLALHTADVLPEPITIVPSRHRDWEFLVTCGTDPHCTYIGVPPERLVEVVQTIIDLLRPPTQQTTGQS